ncbi:MAG: hypothetical protein K8R59_04270, partial [Thermoanaerobaculales bacterium]|nr:hypothetical protein [Thermoanaerobaculales bacterium]
DGTFGQYVPAVPVVPGNSTFFLSGLVHNLYYRTNIRLANMGDESTIAMIQVLDQDGGQLGETMWVRVEAQSTRQINRIAEFVGLPTFLDIFSVRVDTGSEKSGAWASVIDNITGDPVLYGPMTLDEETSSLWVPGIAHLMGENNSRWRTDISFFNTSGAPLSADVAYFPSEDEGFLATQTLHNIQPGTARYYVDILPNEFLPGWIDSSKGYFVISGVGDSKSPHVAARTYNLDGATGGTFGQNLVAFQAKDLILEGSEGYIPGVTMSADSETGFRTNLGLLNTNTQGWSQVRVSVFDEDGNLAGEAEIWLEPGQFIQPNLADRLGIGFKDRW